MRFKSNTIMSLLICAPLVAALDARAAARLVDSYLLVIEWGSTKIEAVQYALRNAPGVRENIVGAVLNKVDMAGMSRYDSYGANYYYGQEPSPCSVNSDHVAAQWGRLSLGANERWFLVHTLAKSERKAQWHLGAQGFRSCLPQIQKTIRHARQLRTVWAPVFPGYLFIVLDLERDRWLSVRSTVGVSRLFTQDGRPVPVPVGIVESLIEQTDGESDAPGCWFSQRAAGPYPVGTFC